MYVCACVCARTHHRSETFHPSTRETMGSHRCSNTAGFIPSPSNSESPASGRTTNSCSLAGSWLPAGPALVSSLLSGGSEHPHGLASTLGSPRLGHCSSLCCLFCSEVWLPRCRDRRPRGGQDVAHLCSRPVIISDFATIHVKGGEPVTDLWVQWVSSTGNVPTSPGGLRQRPGSAPRGGRGLPGLPCCWCSCHGHSRQPSASRAIRTPPRGLLCTLSVTLSALCSKSLLNLAPASGTRLRAAGAPAGLDAVEALVILGVLSGIDRATSFWSWANAVKGRCSRVVHWSEQPAVVTRPSASPGCDCAPPAYAALPRIP
ncbi:uncharacterized protein LOC117196670 [Orcinus orca]|uniref:uncharacterized protein LOC117196670 n=1 Tax=Orcinus orca TaxID=9733 RepID=UPI0014426CA5|nr:uncharacterized protein LOC117196670 [Orcinus orca]